MSERLRRIAATAIRLEMHQRRYSRLLGTNSIFKPAVRSAVDQSWERIKRAEKELREQVESLAHDPQPLTESE